MADAAPSNPNKLGLDAFSVSNVGALTPLTPGIDGFVVEDIITHVTQEVLCPYVKQLKTVKRIETEEDYIKACNDLARLKKRSRRRGGTDLADLVQAEWRNARKEWSEEISTDKKNWKTEKSPYHRRMTKIFVKILCAVKYMNLYHVAHSKLKLDNILVNTKDDVEIVQVIAYMYQVKEGHLSAAETPAYSSPEAVFFKKRRLTYPTYNIEKDDVWQLGCIIFMMLAHQLPYDAGSESDPNFRYATSGTFSPESPGNKGKESLKKLLKFYKVLPMFNDNAIDLLIKIFVPENDRIAVDGIFQHPWLQEELQELIREKSLDWFRDTLGTIVDLETES